MASEDFKLEPPAGPMFDATNSVMAHQVVTRILLQQRDEGRKEKVELACLTVKTPIPLRRDLRRAAKLLRCTQTDLVLEPLKIILPLILAQQNQLS